jgi:hypothetical protein
MKHCAAASIALLFCLSMTGAWAQAGDVRIGDGVQTSSRENTFSSPLSGGIHLRSIAGAPFSADVVKESTRVLPDGRQAPVVMHGKMLRDGEGRTRLETEFLSTAMAAPRRYVTIVDPVQQVSMVLDPQAKTATVSPLPGAFVEQPVKMSARASAVAISTQAPAILGAEDLGTSTVEGFCVIGSRMTRLQEGTENMVVESWFSPELKIELQARIAGPRVGETITKLENIIATEPARALFEIPAGYAVQTISTAQ